MSENKSPVKRFVAAVGASSVSGAAKASPGIAVSGLTIYGYPIETWVSVLTCGYLIAMILSCIPKVGESVRYLWSLAKGTRSVVQVIQKKDHTDLARAVAKAKSASNEAQADRSANA